MRIVITATRDDGKSIVASDSDVKGRSPGILGITTSVIAGSDQLPFTLPHDGSLEFQDSFMPGPNGLRIHRVTVGVGDEVGDPDPNYVAPSEVPETDQVDVGPDGLHRTQTVDILFVIRGVIRMYLDAGEVDLGEGDCLIQFGTRHAWRNIGTVDADVALVILGAQGALAAVEPAS